jgi:hypothetical protein
MRRGSSGPLKPLDPLPSPAYKSLPSCVKKIKRRPFVPGPTVPRGRKRAMGPTKAAVTVRQTGGRGDRAEPSLSHKPSSAVGIGIASLAWVN